MRRAFLVVLIVLLCSAALPALAGDACPTCGEAIETRYRFCPFDGTKLAPSNCPQCKQAMERGWRFCPFDGSALDGPASDSPASDSPARAAVTPTAADTAGPTSTAAPAAKARPAGSKSALLAIEAVIRGLRDGDVARLHPHYDWPRFFPNKRGEALDHAVKAYLARSVDVVTPTLIDGPIRPTKVRLGESDARITVSVPTRTGVAEYEFHVVNDDGWRVVKIAP